MTRGHDFRYDSLAQRLSTSRAARTSSSASRAEIRRGPPVWFILCVIDHGRHAIAGFPADAVATARTGIMKTSQCAKAIGFGLGTSVAAVAVGWAGYAAIEWLEYGHAKSIASRQRDDLLDRFMPAYEIWEQHRVAVDATPAVVFAAAKESNLTDSAIVRAMFKGRELVIGRAPTSNKPLPSGVVEMATSIGWTVLAEIPGREIVFGAATRPWESDAVFRGIAPDAFAAFDEPGYVKIAWTLCADPTGSSTSMFRTDTRVVTTGEEVRAKFRRYWAAFSPGIRLIRRVMLGVVKSSAEARVRRASDLAAMAGQAGPAAASDIPAEW